LSRFWGTDISMPDSKHLSDHDTEPRVLWQIKGKHKKSHLAEVSMD
jgi:hypothetical protein